MPLHTDVPNKLLTGSETTMLKQHLITTYGEVIQKKTTQIQRLKKQAAATKCRWIFLSRCTEHNVLPRSFRTRPVLRTRKAYLLTKEYKQKMLAKTRDEAKKQYHQRRRRIEEINSELQETVSREDHETIKLVTEKSREHKFQKESKRLKEKFERLKTEQTTQGRTQDLVNTA